MVDGRAVVAVKAEGAAEADDDGRNIMLRVFFTTLVIFFIAGSVPTATFADQGQASQTVFKSPEEAMKALVDAVQADDKQKMLNILGSEGKDAISSGDEVADMNNRAKFVKSYQDKVNFVKEADRVSIIIGKDDYPMAIPLVKKGEGWVFNTKEGLQELLRRRIGRNELSSINSCYSYMRAQREYGSVDRTMEGIMQYAQKFCSTPGKRDGLYWEVTEGEQPSPLGASYAAAAGEGYKSGEVCFFSPVPYHGYIYKILTGQGASAPGGAYNYVINGRMVGGFALVVWPAQYGVSGVMTFIVNQNGIVFEKNLGPGTDKIARAMTEYNPDATWSRAQ